MSTRRRVGVPSAATTEAARRQLMQRVQVTWEKKLMPVEGSSLKAYKWIQINQPPVSTCSVYHHAPLRLPIPPIPSSITLP